MLNIFLYIDPTPITYLGGILVAAGVFVGGWFVSSLNKAKRKKRMKQEEKMDSELHSKYEEEANTENKTEINEYVFDESDEDNKK